jgi:hypothetical protein
VQYQKTHDRPHWIFNDIGRCASCHQFASADKLYSLIVKRPRGPRLRQGEKAIVLYRRAWRVIHRLYPDLFDSKVPNPWAGVTKKRRAMAAKPAATREEVYAFAWGAIEAGYPERRPQRQ